MSREIRRVKPGWEHPQEYNPHRRVSDYKPLYADYEDSFHDWTQRGFAIRAHTDWSWGWAKRWSLTGMDDCSCHPGEKGIVHPYVLEANNVTHEVIDEEHLTELVLADWYHEKPMPDDYMPAWTEKEATGWCLYETVSEGTPVTPVFDNANQLIDYLSTFGQFHSGPMRREAAESLVRSGSSMGSMVIIGGQVLKSDEDADKIEELTKGE